MAVTVDFSMGLAIMCTIYVKIFSIFEYKPKMYSPLMKIWPFIFSMKINKLY